MARSAPEYPTQLELQLLKILWEKAPQTARQLRDALAERGRDLAHTSVITTLQKMVDKGQLEQLDPVEGKAYRFAPRLSQTSVARGMLGDLVNRLFDGSREAAVMTLFDTSELDESTLKRLRRAVNQAERGNQE
jgi:predicted transcriptional regulator